ncbi:DUF916 and DUF3324 domain-containing protein [Lacticaseibacillus saniviri]
MKRWYWWLLGLMMSLMIGGTTQVHAAGAGFTVKAHTPETQIDKTASYFDIKVTPGQPQQLAVDVRNLTDEPITLVVSPHDAFTNGNGVIEYSKDKAPLDSTAKVKFSQMMSDKQTVTLGEQEQKTLTFTMTPPTTSFSGTVLGGFYVTPKAKDDEKQESGISIQNNFAMVIGARLREKTDMLLPELKLGAVRAALHNQRTAIKANIRNVAPVLFGKMKVKATATKVGEDKPTYQTAKENLAMAPHSNFDFTIDMKNKAYQAGEYVVKIVATSGKESWTLNKKLTITDDQAKRLNEKASGVAPTDWTWAYITAGVVLLLVAVGLAFYLGRRGGGKK